MRELTYYSIDRVYIQKEYGDAQNKYATTEMHLHTFISRYYRCLKLDWNIHPRCLSSNIGCLLFSKKVARGKSVVDMLLNKNLGFKCAEMQSEITLMTVFLIFRWSLTKAIS